MNIFLSSALVIFVYFLILFIIGQLIKDNSIVDIGWGIGYIVLIGFHMLTAPIVNLSALLVSVLIIIWGLRLSYHIAKRNMGRGEDPRYEKMRARWGRKQKLNAFFKVYMLQALFMYIIATPIMITFAAGGDIFGNTIYIGLAIWFIGFLFEVIADNQLKNFKNKPQNKGKIMTKGLWRYSRHPNYFGEVTIWWGIFVITLSSFNGVMAIWSPILITYLLLFVSGIPMLEEKYKDNKEFIEYAKRTSVFFPLPPKRIKKEDK